MSMVVEPGRFDQALAAYEPLREIVDRHGDDNAVILYTSAPPASPRVPS
ncbi:hypothetical protein AB0F68_34475 [Micromonospora sp. NPDC023966]